MQYTLEKLEVYQLAKTFSDAIWNLVIKWKYFEKDTIGKQMVRAADSILANVAEGYGPYFYKEQAILFLCPRFNSRNEIVVI